MNEPLVITERDLPLCKTGRPATTEPELTHCNSNSVCHQICAAGPLLTEFSRCHPAPSFSYPFSKRVSLSEWKGRSSCGPPLLPKRPTFHDPHLHPLPFSPPFPSPQNSSQYILLVREGSGKSQGWSGLSDVR